MSLRGKKKSMRTLGPSQPVPDPTHPSDHLVDVSGIRIVSDGTRDGTNVLIDGVELKGITEVEWKINTQTRHATVVLHMRDVAMDAEASVPADVAEALARVQEWTLAQKKRNAR